MQLPINTFLNLLALDWLSLRVEYIKTPSLGEVMTALQEVLTIFSEGGPKAIAFIFFLNLLLICVVVFFVSKFIWKFVKEQNDDKEKALAAKDELLNSARQRSEAVAKQYAKLAAQSIEREQLLMNELRELKTLVMLFLKK